MVPDIEREWIEEELRTRPPCRTRPVLWGVLAVLLLLVAAQFTLVLVLHLMARLGRIVFEPTGRGRAEAAESEHARS